MLNHLKIFKSYTNKIHYSSYISINNKFIIDILVNPKCSLDIKLSAIKQHINNQQSYIKHINQLFNIRAVTAYVKHNDLFDNISPNIIQQFNLNAFVNAVMTGYQFNRYFPVELITSINGDLVKGINVYPKEFNLSQNSVGGILSFDLKYLNCLDTGRLSWIPSNALLRIEYNQIKSNMIVIE